jgi:succinate-semialdehyde dehydrogenase/glutarate-semialdehyde dehydrogenase
MVLDVVKTFVVGNGFGEKTTHGPLIHGRAVAKTAEHVEDAISKGAKLIHGGERLPDLGPNFFGMTMLTDMTPDMKIFSEETFGPVAAFFAFDNEEEVIELANDSEVGLGGYFFSENVGRCYRVAEALEVGMIGVNCGKSSSSYFAWLD